MKPIRSAPSVPSTTDALRRVVRVDISPCYDLISSLRALYGPRIYRGQRRWASATRRVMPRDLYHEGREFFQGDNASVGTGALRLVPPLRAGSDPSALVDAVRKADPVELGGHMIEAVLDLPRERMDAIRGLVGGKATSSQIAKALQGVAGPRRQRVIDVIRAPAGMQKRLARFLERYHEAVFAALVPQLKDPLAAAERAARDALAAHPAVEAIELLANGYTVSEDLKLHRVTLAPSVFVYPYVCARVDETRGDALIAYGVPSTLSEPSSPARVDADLTRALKALSDENRLRILQLVMERPRYGPEIVEILGLAQPTVHHHLAQLRSADLLRQQRTRSGMLFTLREDGAARTIDALAGFLRPGADTDRPRRAARPVALRTV